MKKNLAMRCLIVLMVLLMTLSGCETQPAEAAPQEEGDTVAAAQLINLVNFEGEVTVRDSEGKETAAYEGMRLIPGDIITTGSDSLANLDLDQGRLVMLSAETQLELRQVQADSVTLYLKKGSVLNDVAKGSGSYTVQTDNMTMGVLGTIFGVVSDPAANADSALLFEGSLQISFSKDISQAPSSNEAPDSGAGFDVAFLLTPGQQFSTAGSNIKDSIATGALQSSAIDYSIFSQEQSAWLVNALQSRGNLLEENELDVLEKLRQQNTVKPARPDTVKPKPQKSPSQENTNPSDGGVDTPSGSAIGSIDTASPTSLTAASGAFPEMQSVEYVITVEENQAYLTATGTNVLFCSQNDSRDFLSLIFSPYFTGSNTSAPVYIRFEDSNRNFGTIRAFRLEGHLYSSMSIINATPKITASEVDADTAVLECITTFSLTDPDLLKNTRAYNMQRDAMIYTYAPAPDEDDPLLTEGSYLISTDGVKYATATSLQISAATPTVYIKTDASFDGTLTWNPINPCATNLWNYYGLVRAYQPIIISVQKQAAPGTNDD